MSLLGLVSVPPEPRTGPGTELALIGAEGEEEEEEEGRGGGRGGERRSRRPEERVGGGEGEGRREVGREKEGKEVLL